MKTSDLIAELSKHPADAKVVATWEGIFRDIDVFVAPNGFVVLDVGGEGYRERIESGELVPYC